MSERIVESVVERAYSRLDALERTVEALHVLRGTASSPDGRVTARVDGSGALEDLQLSEAIRGADPRELSAVILATVHEAARNAGAARVATMEALRSSLAATAGTPSTVGDRSVPI
ncbi:YbaB/EbfC family nucleoid-associated protein [Rhodococcus sp. NPDC047139]|uniref:YbaB/EbfC family nucleoid-associated protein n=1 Tax=Rhodococcus sp. NPDC047139 TaxID=3155141 RepID=UPI003404654F